LKVVRDNVGPGQMLRSEFQRSQIHAVITHSICYILRREDQKTLIIMDYIKHVK